MKSGEKQERINEARFMKHYMLERKKKLKVEKEQTWKEKRDKNLSQLRSDQEVRNEILDEKWKNSRTKVKNKKGSLPLVSGSKATQLLFLNGPGEEWRGKQLNVNS